MILADTSVWIDHFRTGNHSLREYLAQGQVMTHPFVIAELALGSLKERTRTLALLDQLPQLRAAHTNEVRILIETRRLYSRGLGLVDAHLLASVFLSPPTLLWTKDKQLGKVAQAFGIRAVI